MRSPRTAARSGLVLVAGLLGAFALTASATRNDSAPRRSASIAPAGSVARTRPAARPRLAARPLAPRPRIIRDFIPIGSRREAETRAYAKRHYGIVGSRLVGPHVIVEHFTGSETYQSAHDTFVPDAPDSELGELPGLCSQFIIDRDGRIYQQTPALFVCRHTVGLNWTAIGVELVGSSDREILADHRQLAASIALTRWLQSVYAIPSANVIGHNESLSSRYHCEHVAALRDQTHDDWSPAHMRIYRRLLGSGPPGASRGRGADQHAASCAARLSRSVKSPGARAA